MNVSNLTAVLTALITEDLVWGVEGVRLDHVHLRFFATPTEDVLTLLTWSTRGLKTLDKIHLYDMDSCIKIVCVWEFILFICITCIHH